MKAINAAKALSVIILEPSRLKQWSLELWPLRPKVPVLSPEAYLAWVRFP
jgi:hypothetical protein